MYKRERAKTPANKDGVKVKCKASLYFIVLNLFFSKIFNLPRFGFSYMTD